VTFLLDRLFTGSKRGQSRKPKHQPRPCFPIRRQVSSFADHLSSSLAVKFPINSVHVIKSNKIFTSSQVRRWKKASLQPRMILIDRHQPKMSCMYHIHCAIAEPKRAARRKRWLLSAVPGRPVPGRGPAACGGGPIADHHHDLLLPYVRREEVAEPFLQACDTLVVVLLDLSEELEPLGRFRNRRDGIVIEREGVEEPWGRRNRARTPVAEGRQVHQGIAGRQDFVHGLRGSR